MIYAPCNSLGHWEQGTPGRGSFIQAFAGPSCNRIHAAYKKGDTAAMTKASQYISGCNNAGGNFVERYFYQYLWPGANLGPGRSPQPDYEMSSPAIVAMNKTLQGCGFYTDSWPPPAK